MSHLEIMEIREIARHKYLRSDIKATQDTMFPSPPDTTEPFEAADAEPFQRSVAGSDGLAQLFDRFRNFQLSSDAKRSEAGPFYD